MSPYDTWVSGGLRFLAELVTWVAGPWAAGKLLGGWAILPAALVLVGLPAIFSVPGDKRQVLVAIPGPARFGLEIDLGIIGVIAAWYVWPTSAAVVATGVLVLSQITGWRRGVWLIRGAQLPTDQAG